MLCRLNQSDCFTKDNPYYWTTNMGLNTLVGSSWLLSEPVSFHRLLSRVAWQS